MNAPPPCAGKWELFDSVDRRDHHTARAICATCPILGWCAQRAELLKREHSYCRPLTGTWAGRLYGRPVGGQPKLAPQDEPSWTDEELRAFHAAYVRGERDEATRLGDRIYSRRRKRAARQAKSEVDEAVVLRILAGEKLPANHAERVEALSRWRSAGNSARSLCQFQGWNEGRYSRVASADEGAA